MKCCKEAGDFCYFVEEQLKLNTVLGGRGEGAETGIPTTFLKRWKEKKTQRGI